MSITTITIIIVIIIIIHYYYCCEHPFWPRGLVHSISETGCSRSCHLLHLPKGTAQTTRNLNAGSAEFEFG